MFYNLGGQFNANATSLVGDATGFKRRVRAVDNAGTWTWQLETDLIDLDGNGIPESVTFPSSSTIARAEHNPLAPPRLLWKVVNNRGADTTVAYASMHDDAVVSRASAPPPSPANQWVVKSMTTVDHVPNDVSSTTSYQYKDPQFGADDEDRRAFRGFGEVTTTGPSGSKLVQRYGYAPDWSGRLVTSLVVPAEAPAQVRSIEKTTWEERQLFGGAVKTYHATVVERFTCANGQTEATCTPAAAPGYTRATSTLTALASTNQPGSPLLWQETSNLLQGGTTSADGDRETVSTFAFKADVVTDATSYRLRPLTSTRNHRVGGTMTMFGKSATTWDADFKVPLTSEVWFDTNDANRAIARSVYDMNTGNVIQRFKPKQNAAGTTSTTFTYDSRKLFATTMVNEIGHQLDFTFEYGTGTKLQTDGPNTRGCTSGCPSGSIYPVKEQHKIRVDGLGRQIEKWDTTSDDGYIYTLHLRETTSYVDAYAAPTPPSVTHQTRLDSAGPVWKQEKTELDGHGRTSRKIVFAQGSAPTDHITSFTYRPDGTLQTVKVPDPTANDATVVTYSYGFDSLGRPTSLRRPDAIPALDQSGVDIEYDGLTTTTTEFVGAGGGNIAQTITLKDRFGRLVEVHERTADASFAVTEYVHGPDDLVTTVIDPSNVTTTMAHDFAGRRTQITRPGNRTWKYTYDKNGNVIAEQVPGSPSPPVTDPDYTTTIAYDDLDRPASKVIGQRNLSVADQALFGSRTETYAWDLGGNHKGYLRYWQSFAPSTSTASVTLDVGNNNQGQRTVTNHTLNIAGYPSLFRQYINYYWLFGGVRQTRYGDLVGGTNQTIVTTNYDARLLPSYLLLTRTGEPNQIIANQTRNVAGLVTKRRTDTTGAMTFVESNWTYDKLGRVVDQVVQKGPGPTQVARQSLTYFGNDDPATLDHYLGTTQRHFVYGYDLRHQLTSAVETTTPGYYASSYHYGAPTSAGRFTRAVEAQTIAVAGSEVKPRDVTYFYNGADPEQVTHLRITNSNTAYATYTYDAVGNQTSRCLGPDTNPCTGELLEYVYDGKDQLRRVTKKVNGSVTGSEEYWYQSEGNRVALVKRDSAGQKTEMIWFIGDTQAHYDPSGAVTHAYSHPSLGTPVARVDRTANNSTSLEYQFHGLASGTLATVEHGGSVGSQLSYTPFGMILEATEGSSGSLATHQRRHNDKYRDSLSDLAYYGHRYYDSVAITWTQADPKYRVIPDDAAHEPRRAAAYMYTLNNPLAYVDPDGLETRSVGLSIPKAVQTKEALQELAQDFGEVHFYYTAGATSFKFDWVQTAEQKARTAKDRAMSDLATAFADPGRVYAIQNVDAKNTNAEERATDDRAREAVAEHGFAGTFKERVVNDKPTVTIVIDYSSTTNGIKNQVMAEDDKEQTNMTPGVALGHELLTHGVNRITGAPREKEARQYENDHLRYPRGMKKRSLKQSSKPLGGGPDGVNRQPTKRAPVKPFSCGIECVKAF